MAVVKRGMLLVALVSLLLLAIGCSHKPTPPKKVILVGIDAADWDLMRPLLDAGLLPNFMKLVKKGAVGPLRTLIPLEKSPTLWTSIATSKLPSEHGIGGYVKGDYSDEGLLYTGNTRRVKALWNILSEKGYRVAVVGWMVTWPAEEVNGYLVSDYIQYETEKGIKLEKQTYPEDLFDEIDRFRLSQADVTDQDISSIFPIDINPGEKDIAPWHKDYVKMIWATDETYRRIAHYLNSKGVDLLAVYFNGIDSMCHAFWYCRDQEDHPLQYLIDDYYIWMDKVLGEFLDLVDSSTLLVVCSDHGFHGPRQAEDGSTLLGVFMHGEYGIVGLMGKGIEPGAKIVGATILDITPTILYAMGLPIARDMKGKVLTDAFEKRFLEANQPLFVETYEQGQRPVSEPIKSPVDSIIKRKLKALGYIQ